MPVDAALFLPIDGRAKNRGPVLALWGEKDAVGELWYVLEVGDSMRVHPFKGER